MRSKEKWGVAKRSKQQWGVANEITISEDAGNAERTRGKDERIRREERTRKKRSHAVGTHAPQAPKGVLVGDAVQHEKEFLCEALPVGVFACPG